MAQALFFLVSVHAVINYCTAQLLPHVTELFSACCAIFTVAHCCHAKKNLSRNFEIISQNFDLLSQNFEITISKF